MCDMSVVHLAKDPLEILKGVDEKTAEMLEKLGREYNELLFFKERKQRRRVRVYVVTEASSNTS